MSSDKLIILEDLVPGAGSNSYLVTIGPSFAFIMGVYVMKFIPAYTVNLSVNLEPIYAIILALIIFKDSEIMSINFYIGSAIVVGSILLNAFFKKNKKKPHIVT